MEVELLDVYDVMKICKVKKGKAYGIIKALNTELEKNKIYVITGRVPKDYLYTRLSIEKK